MGSKAVVNGLAIGDEKVVSVDVPLNDFVSASAIPYPAPSEASASTSHSLQTVFINPGRMVDYANMVKTQLLQKLIPKMQKEGYEETAKSTTEQAEQRRNTRQDIDDMERAAAGRPRVPNDPLADPRLWNEPYAEPRRPHPDLNPPGFDDDYEILRPPGRGGLGGIGGGLRGPNIGERDLYPPGLGSNDPLRIGPGGFGRPGGGMHPNFDDPLFDGRRGEQGGFNPMAPPGARYDPVGPGDGVPRDPLRNRRFPPGGGGMGGGPPNPFGGFGGNDFI